MIIVDARTMYTNAIKWLSVTIDPHYIKLPFESCYKILLIQKEQRKAVHKQINEP